MNLKSFIQLCSWKNFKRIINDYVLSSKDPNSKVVYSIMLGVFMSASPFWGFQALVTLCFAVLFRLNKVISVTFTSFNVPFIPLILFLSYSIGATLLNQPVIFTINEIDQSVLGAILIPYLLGSVVLSLILALVIGLIFSILLHFTRHPDKNT